MSYRNNQRLPGQPPLPVQDTSSGDDPDEDAVQDNSDMKQEENDEDAVQDNSDMKQEENDEEATIDNI